MKETDRRIKLRMVQLAEAYGITHHVAVGYQGVHLICRRPFAAAFHCEIANDDLKGIVVRLPDVTLNTHELFYCLRDGNRSAILLYGFNLDFQVALPSFIVS